MTLKKTLSGLAIVFSLIRCSPATVKTQENSEPKNLISGQCNFLEKELFEDRCLNTLSPSLDAMVQKFPDAAANAKTDENPKIMCPFLRLMERAKAFVRDASAPVGAIYPVEIKEIVANAREFGCSSLECGSVALLVEQAHKKLPSYLPGHVDLGKLHLAGPVSHECGLTYDFGGDRISDKVRERTLARLAEFADAQGQLQWEDLFEVKLEICEDQQMPVTTAGELEIDLIYLYLGGLDRDSISLSDVDLFLHAKLPRIKMNGWINAHSIAKIKLLKIGERSRLLKKYQQAFF
jgi:hypothetical protein